MRWDHLFSDLESQLEQGLSAEELDLAAEEERLRLGRLGLRDRLVSLHERGGAMRRLVVTLIDGSRITIETVAFGRDWFSADILDELGRRRHSILPLGAIATVTLSAEQIAVSLAARPPEPHPSLPSRLGLPFVLRDLCRRRHPLEIVTAQGRSHGTLDRVGRDHLDLAVHEPGTVRRHRDVTELRLVAFDSLVVVLL